jgi:hypothetical protein
MSVDLINEKHLHVWTKSIDGAEFGNVLYDNEVDAALAFLGIMKNVTKGNVPNEDVTIEQVMQSLDEGRRGMYAGYPGLIMVISRCDGGCKSPVWN